MLGVEKTGSLGLQNTSGAISFFPSGFWFLSATALEQPIQSMRWGEGDSDSSGWVLPAGVLIPQANEGGHDSSGRPRSAGRCGFCVTGVVVAQCEESSKPKAT